MTTSIAEQRRCADWMVANGYPTPFDGPRRTDAQLAAIGAVDWVVEELMEMEEKQKWVKVTRPDSHGDKFGCWMPLAVFSAEDEFDGAEVGERVTLELYELTKAEVDAMPEFTGW